MNGPVSVGGGEIPCHHGSHQQLVRFRADAAPIGPGVDAIVVPTARRPPYLSGVAQLARELKCPLVTLHSTKWTSANTAATYLLSDATAPDLDLIAIDVPELDKLNLPNWRTSQLIANTIFARRTDLSTKRNLALVLSRMVGWSSILFLDDDITGLNADDVRRASWLLDTYNSVGLSIGGFPDNSVVCHAFRDAGGSQQTFVGGGALAIVNRCKSFFPDIYNDDWFFLLDGDKWIQPTAVTGGVVQYPYDPFRPSRARAEEFGDVLAEGIYWLLDQDRSIRDANKEHWRMFLGKRRTFIQNTLEMISKGGLAESEKTRRVEALKSSLGRLARIRPEFCESYLKAWLADRDEWHRHLELLPTHMRIEQAIDHLSRRGHPHLRRHVAHSDRRMPIGVGK